MPTLYMVAPETSTVSAPLQVVSDVLASPASFWQVASGATTRSTPCGLPAAGQSARLSEEGTAREPAGLHVSGELAEVVGIEEPAGPDSCGAQAVPEEGPARGP